MRYDDMLATVLAQPVRDPAARVRVWRQIVDLLAQGRAGSMADRTTDRAYDMARVLRPDIPVPLRLTAAATCIDRRVPARLIGFFAEDAPEIAGPLLSQARLEAQEWLSILPSLSPFAKGQLRAREDLPEEIAYALGVALDGYDNDRDIDDLIERMESRRVQPVQPLSPPVARREAPAEPPHGVRIDSFRFTTDDAGVIAVREPGPDGISGATIAAVASTPDHGVDGHAAGAWRRRAAFSEARLSISGEGPGAGQWRISAEPCFAAPDGRFVGYAGEARRPRVEEAKLAPMPPPPEPVLSDADREERADRFIEALAGPIDLIGILAPLAVREAEATRRAGQAARGLRLLDATPRGGGRNEDDRLDAAAILTRLHEACHAGAEERGVRLSFRIAAGLPPIAADPALVERMFTRLLAATLGISRRGECVAVRVGLDRRNGSLLALSVSRPGVLAGMDEHTLLGPSADDDGDLPDAPRLVLSFAIRLVRNLAGEAGGRLDIGPDRIILSLPLASGIAGVERSG